jgi:hypothetical protein
VWNAREVASEILNVLSIGASNQELWYLFTIITADVKKKFSVFSRESNIALKPLQYNQLWITLSAMQGRAQRIRL